MPDLFIKYLDVLGNNEYYEIGFGGDLFYDALDALKKDIDAADRKFDSETKRWTIVISQANTNSLGLIFPTFKEELRILKSQTSFW